MKYRILGTIRDISLFVPMLPVIVSVAMLALLAKIYRIAELRVFYGGDRTLREREGFSNWRV